MMLIVTGLFGNAGTCARAGEATRASSAVAASVLNVSRRDVARGFQLFLLEFIVFLLLSKNPTKIKPVPENGRAKRIWLAFERARAVPGRPNLFETPVPRASGAGASPRARH